MLITKVHIEKFRGFINQDFEVGSMLTAIAGQNGTQKSTLLGMITQTFTLSKDKNPMGAEKPLCGGNYRSAFSDKFRLSPDFDKIVIPTDKGIIGDVIDGQHRLWGIESSKQPELFQLPVVFMFDLTVAEQAYIFSTINSNQRKVDPSLIYDLFDVSENRSPYKTVHEIARVMNSSESSPFYNRLKMLGKRTSNQEKATLSQGTFAKSILMLISKKPDEDTRNLKLNKKLANDPRLPLRFLFIEEKDDILVKILSNCFNALKEVFPAEWETPTSNILWKSTGFRAVIYALSSLCRKGLREHVLTKDFFIKCFEAFKEVLSKEQLTLTSKSFPGGGEQNQKKTCKYTHTKYSKFKHV